MTNFYKISSLPETEFVVSVLMLLATGSSFPFPVKMLLLVVAVVLPTPTLALLPLPVGGGGVVFSSLSGNLIQLPLPMTPVVSSESSPVCRCNQAFLRCLGAVKELVCCCCCCCCGGNCFGGSTIPVWDEGVGGGVGAGGVDVGVGVADDDDVLLMSAGGVRLFAISCGNGVGGFGLDDTEPGSILTGISGVPGLRRLNDAAISMGGLLGGLLSNGDTDAAGGGGV